MTNKKFTHKNLFITLLTLILFVGLFSAGRGDTVVAGVTDTIKEIQQFIEGWRIFFSRLSAITSLVGFKTLLLFMAILVISSGLSSIGLPRGKVSFILALLVADTVWIAFSDSFNPGKFTYLGPVIRANLTICAPMLLFYLSPLIWRKTRSLLSRDKKSDSHADAEVILARSLDLYKSIKNGDSSTGEKSSELQKLLKNMQ